MTVPRLREFREYTDSQAARDYELRMNDDYFLRANSFSAITAR